MVRQLLKLQTVTEAWRIRMVHLVNESSEGRGGTVLRVLSHHCNVVVSRQGSLHLPAYYPA